MDWFRWWHGTVTDPKFQWVARRSGHSVGAVIAVWAALLEHASNATQCNADATRGNVASFDCNDFDIAFGFEDGVVQAIYSAMESKGLIVDGELAKWGERQPKREDSGNPNTGALSSTERSRNRRAKLKENATDCTDTQRNATQCNAVQRGAPTDKSREEEIREKQCGDGDGSGRVEVGDHTTSHLQSKQTGEENSRPVQIRILLRKHGMPVTSNSAEVLDMVRLAVTDQEIVETVDVFQQRKPGDKPNAKYILSMITTAREKAAKAVASAGTVPDARASPSESGQWWRGGASAIEAKGSEHGVKWRRDRNENFQDFKVRVFKAAGEGPWMEDMLGQLLKDKSDRYVSVHEHFYGHPPIEVQA